MSEPCRNMNHGKMNVTVRFCSACGEIVNKNIGNKKCDSSAHASRRKNRDAYCIDCGENLLK